MQRRPGRARRRPLRARRRGRRGARICRRPRRCSSTCARTLGRTGTKEGCAEGDCGACTVVLGRAARGDAHRATAPSIPASASCRRSTARKWSPWRACRAPDGTLHPVQQAMVDCHASQCGFCTPGFVMSLFAPVSRARAASRRARRRRARSPATCAAAPATGRSSTPVRMHALSASPRRWSRADAQIARARDARLRCASRCAAGRCDRRASTRRARSTSWPSAYAARPDSLLLAGGTDVGLWVTKQLRDLPPHHLSRRRARSCDAIARSRAALLEIGAAVEPDRCLRRASSRATRAGRAGRPLRLAADPQLGHARRQLANGSPIGDSMPVADRARRRAWSCAAATATRELPLEAVLSRLPEEGAGAGRVRARGARAAAARRTALWRATRSPSASTRTSPRCAPPSRVDVRRRARSPTRASPSAAWRRSRSARRPPRPRCRQALDRASDRRRAAPRSRRTSSRSSDMRASAAYRLRVARQPARALLPRAQRRRRPRRVSRCDGALTR